MAIQDNKLHIEYTEYHGVKVVYRSCSGAPRVEKSSH
jgi:hypothetical protein